MPEFDLLLRGGTVIDPGVELNAPRDVGVLGGRIAAVCDPSQRPSAKTVLDVAGLYVVPGLIDFHVHVFPGVSHFGIDADSSCLAHGVTTAIDFGTAGALTFEGFRRFVLDVSQTRLFALLHIASQGLISSHGSLPALGDLADLRYCSVEAVVQTAQRHRDLIVGVKIRLTDNLAEGGKNEAEALRLARRAADETGLPLVAHSPDSSLPMPFVLEHFLRRRRADALLPRPALRHCRRVGPVGRHRFATSSTRAC